MYASQLYSLRVAFCSGTKPLAMGLLSEKMGHFTGLFGRASGSAVLPTLGGVPLPHASRNAPALDRANVVPAARLMNSRRLIGPGKMPRSRGWRILDRLPSLGSSLDTDL